MPIIDMIKEIFEIDPKQKNVLIIIIGIFGLSFLQLYLFKKSIFDIGILFSIGISLGLTVCWTMLNVPSLAFFHGVLTNPSPNEESPSAINNQIIFLLGLVSLAWISLLTFISYLF